MGRSFEDPALAARFLDAIRSVVSEELDRQRPGVRYGKVVSVSAADRTCMVVLNGDEAPVPVRFGSFAGNVMPNLFVRVAGSLGDKYIDGVWGGGDGLWRKFPATLQNDWSVGDGYIDVRYSLQGMTCTVNWQVMFLDGDNEISTGETGSLFGIEMPFAREAGNQQAVGTAFRTGILGSVDTYVSRMSSSTIPQYANLVNKDNAGGVTGSEVTNNRVFSGTVVYQVSAFSVQLYLILAGELPGTLLQ